MPATLAPDAVHDGRQAAHQKARRRARQRNADVDPDLTTPNDLIEWFGWVISNLQIAVTANAEGVPRLAARPPLTCAGRAGLS